MATRKVAKSQSRKVAKSQSKTMKGGAYLPKGYKSPTNIENPSRFKTRGFISRVKSGLGIRLTPKARIGEQSILSGTTKYRKPTRKNIFTPHFFDKNSSPTMIEGQFRNTSGRTLTLEHLDLNPDVKASAQKLLNQKVKEQESIREQASYL